MKNLREKPTKHYRKIGNHKERDQEKEQRRTIKTIKNNEQNGHNYIRICNYLKCKQVKSSNKTQSG